jgi:leucyl/phenylalanyl-tRNA--protein transferase
MPTPLSFPDPRHAPDDGLLAYGGNLHPDTLRRAYALGIFPWFNDDQPILWWSPNPRYLLVPATYRPRKSLLRWLKSRDWSITTDHAFGQIIRACAAQRANSDGTWITTDMQQAYCDLHHDGDAHSVEVWEGNTLVGGLYGVAVGRCFCGESIVTLANNGGNTAILALVSLCQRWGFETIDCQTETDHLVNAGAAPIPRETFLDQLERLRTGSPNAHWQERFTLRELIQQLESGADQPLNHQSGLPHPEDRQ